MAITKILSKIKTEYSFCTMFITACLASVFLVFASAFTAFSAENISFTLSDNSTNNNRLFTVSMKASCSKKLCAASFEFTYDKSMFSFRSADSDDDSTILKSFESDNSVKLVFLNTDGKNINNGSVIFNLTFKAIEKGTGYIDFYASDCVDADVNPINIGSCTSAKITVGSDNDSDKSKNSDQSEISDGGGNHSVRGDEQTASTLASLDEIGTLNLFDDQNTRFLIIGIALGACLIAGFLIVCNVIKKVKSRSSDNKNSSDK